MYLKISREECIKRGLSRKDFCLSNTNILFYLRDNIPDDSICVRYFVSLGTGLDRIKEGRDPEPFVFPETEGLYRWFFLGY